MKKMQLINIIFLVFYYVGFSQNQGVNNNYQVLDPSNSGKIFKNPFNVKNKPEGSPYLQVMFSSAKIDKLDLKAFMRYNVYEDNFEFISAKKDTLILDKIEDFSTIVFTANNKKYILTTYLNSKNKLFNGYLISIYEKGNFILFKKENINFIAEKIAKTTLEIGMPAKYTKSSDSYFFKNKDKNIIEFPESKKKLLKLFPEKKEIIETFLKENKLSFEEESDMVKILDLIATL